MYDTTFECRYHRKDVFLDTDDLNDKEREFVRNLLYKEDLLNIFVIDFSDDADVFSGVMVELYNRVNDCAPLKSCMEAVAQQTAMSSDLQMGLCILYSFDYMYITHLCVSEYLETGSISEKHLEELNRAINNIV